MNRRRWIKKLRHDPFPFIFAQGDKATRLACLEFFGLRGSPLAIGCQLSVSQRQRSGDGYSLTHLLMS